MGFYFKIYSFFDNIHYCHHFCVFLFHIDILISAFSSVKSFTKTKTTNTNQCPAVRYLKTRPRVELSRSRSMYYHIYIISILNISWNLSVERQRQSHQERHQSYPKTGGKTTRTQTIGPHKECLGTYRCSTPDFFDFFVKICWKITFL